MLPLAHTVKVFIILCCIVFYFIWSGGHARGLRGCLQVLQRVVAQRALSIFVHPVPPVLRETRHIAMRFNDLMRRKVCAADTCHSRPPSAGQTQAQLVLLV